MDTNEHELAESRQPRMTRISRIKNVRLPQTRCFGVRRSRDCGTALKALQNFHPFNPGNPWFSFNSCSGPLNKPTDTKISFIISCFLECFVGKTQSRTKLSAKVNRAFSAVLTTNGHQ